MARPETRQHLTDVTVLAALAHPARIQLLDLLMARPRTATDCADVVGLSPSACSYHLRHLEKFGLVRRVAPSPGDDGRERRWEPVATGLVSGGAPSTASPAQHAAVGLVVAAGVDEAARLAKDYVARAATLPADWQDAAGFATFNLVVTPAELVALGTAMDELLRPFIGLTRTDAPAGAEPVRVSVQAFRRVDS
jgi:DNA-binding transcriptional ArsR family regulator